LNLCFTMESGDIGTLLEECGAACACIPSSSSEKNSLCCRAFSASIPCGLISISPVDLELEPPTSDSGFFRDEISLPFLS